MEIGNVMNANVTFRCLCNEFESYKILFSVNGKTICRCKTCGQVYVRGIDSNIVEIEYDESSYFTERNCYLEKQKELSAHFQKILDKVLLYKSNGTFLDIGCSVGLFLDAARQKGFAVKGVEVSKWASEFARQQGFDVFTGDLLDSGYPDKCFDVVVMNHVLEHIPEPTRTLEEVRRILTDDGLFIIGVPNFDSYMARLMEREWFSLMPDQHIWQFTHKSLGNLLKRTGFSEVYFEAKDNHKICGWRPIKVLKKLVNFIAIMANNAEAMLVFARKIRND